MEQPEGLAREPGKGVAQREGTREDVSQGELSPPNRSGHGGEGRVVGNGNIPFQRKGQEIHFSCRIS